MNKFVLFDVGANTGTWSINIAKNDPNALVYGFEPTPRLVSMMKKEIEDLNNYFLHQVAVSDFEGTTIFNIAGQGDWGCSSLLPLSEKAKTEWYGRTDMFVTEQIEVQVIRLDSFIEQHNIPHINYLHIDTQGSDLNVLRGMGKYLSIVSSGVIEAAAKQDILYVNQNTQEESVAFLEQNNFIITKIESNDPVDNEVNIYFKRPVHHV